MAPDVVVNSGSRHIRARAVVAVAAVLLTFLTVGASSVDAAPAVLSAPGCTIVGGPGPDVLEGTPRDDVICGRGGDDRLVGRGGDDQLRGGEGDDELSGGGGNDLVRGEQGKDVVKGGAGVDHLRGGKGNDQLDGRDAAGYGDIVRCGPGTADRAFADMGDDVVSGCEVLNQNDPPTGIRLKPATVAESSPVGTLVGMLEAKDPDPGDRHSFALVTGGGAGDNGSFTIQGRRLLTAAVFDVETDPSLLIRVRATDLEGATFAKSLRVTVTDVADNAAPLAVDDSRTTPEDTALVLPAAGSGGPAGNDTDSDGDPLAVTAVSGAVGGTATSTAGTIRFRPTADLCGVAAGRFDYIVSDGHGGSDVGRVTVDITCVPDDPTAADDAVTRAEDSAAAAVAVLANDSDPDGDPLVIGSVSQPAHGTAAITGGGSGLTYEPEPDYCNDPGAAPVDTFTYTLTPGGDRATVAVTVTCVDDPPSAVDDTATVVEDSGATAIDVLANDLNADGGPITIGSVTQPANGTVVVTGGGTALTYQPDSGFCGATPDTFTYTLNGGDSAIVSVTVACFAPSISTSLSATPAAPSINQPFSYDASVVNAGNVPLDGVTMTFGVPIQMNITSVTTGAYQGFADQGAGVGVRVRYEKNTAPGVFTLWGASPNTTTNTTLTAPPPGLGAGEYVTRVRWDFGQAAPGALATIHPRIMGQIVNPDHAGNPVTTGTTIQAQVLVSGLYTAGPTNVNDHDVYSFSPGPAGLQPHR